MRCSSCSRVVRPIVAVDIDGTLGDYHGHFMEFAESYTGHTARTTYQQSNGPHREWFCNEFGSSVDEFRQIKLAYRQGGMKRSMPAFPGATELCQEIRASGGELWLTTTRPYLRLDNVDPDTRFWLERHGITYDGLLYDELKYQRLAELVEHDRVVAIVDDLYEMIEAAIDAFGSHVPIHRVNYYNRPYGPSWADNLDDLLQEVVARIARWNDEYTGNRNG